MVLMAVVWAGTLSGRPYVVKVILNRLAAGNQADVFVDLLYPAMVYLTLHLGMTLSMRLYGYFVEIKMIPHMRKTIAQQAVDLLMEKSHTYYQNTFAGSLANKINNLTTSVPELLQCLIDKFFCNTLTLSIAIITLWMTNVRFAIFMFCWVALFLGSVLLFSKKFNHLSDAWAEIGSSLTGKFVDIFSNILPVRLFAKKRQERDDLNHSFQAAVDAEQKLYWAYFWLWVGYGGTFFIVQALNFYWLLRGRQEGWISIGDFALVLIINGAIVSELWSFAQVFSTFSKLYGRITQALRDILHAPAIEDAKDATTLVVTHGAIRFEQVRFGYPGNAPLFENLTVTISPGEKVGLVGYSGGGKTTFVNLLLRLYDLTGGAIFIDSQDIRQVTQDSLRANIAMIPQDPSLFHRSLMENIRYGRLNATNREVIDAAKQADAHEFIMQLPQGYDVHVGERGVKLSGGQRQRIAIARAILKNAPILILDEATSQLDSITENHIQSGLWPQMEGKTTLVIAHRLSTLLKMDRILVFDQGNVIEDGSHAQLIARDGLYKTLWDAQVGGFLPSKSD